MVTLKPKLLWIPISLTHIIIALHLQFCTHCTSLLFCYPTYKLQITKNKKEPKQKQEDPPILWTSLLSTAWILYVYLVSTRSCSMHFASCSFCCALLNSWNVHEQWWRTDWFYVWRLKFEWLWISYYILCIIFYV